MAYVKKKWKNREEISESELGQYPRFDADNMNRIEDGIEEALDYTYTTFIPHLADKSNPHGVNFSNIEGVLPISKGGTGNSNSTNAANSLSVKSLGNGTSIPENADLNSYTNAGNYVCSTSASAQTLSNCPITAAFNMTVYLANGSISYLIQELTHFISGVTYFRSYSLSNKTWSEWRSVYSTINKPTAADVGALSIEGGVISGALGLKDGYGTIASDKNCIAIATKNLIDDNNYCRKLYLANSNNQGEVKNSLYLQDIINGEVENYKIFGQHNKPSGTYAGNGKTDTRAINVGGTGKVLFIIGDAASCGLLVHPGGAFGSYGTSSSSNYQNFYNFSKSKINYTDGVLTIKDDHICFNSLNNTYEYQVL